MIYNSIISSEDADESNKAKAQLHIGLCYEKLGKVEAKKAYETVLKKYQKFENEVQIASRRLSELNKEENKELSIIKLFEKPLLYLQNVIS